MKTARDGNLDVLRYWYIVGWNYQGYLAAFNAQVVKQSKELHA